MTTAERITRAVALLARPTTIVTRPLWIDCSGGLRMARGDTAQMLEDLSWQTRS